MQVSYTIISIAHRRYVREWLGLMVVSKIVDVSETKRYFLPLHRRATLRTAPPGGCQGIASWAVPMNAGVINELMDCFQKDGPRGKAYCALLNNT